jgi:hypothetical protein
MSVTWTESVSALLPEKAREISEVDLGVLAEALEISDLETVQEITGLSRRDVARLAVKFRESRTGYRVRDVFCTRDARALMRETLAILAQYGVTSVGRNALASLTPSLSREAVEKKLGRLSEFLQFFQQLGRGQTDSIMKALAEAGFARPEPERPPMVIASNAEERAQLLKKFGQHIRVEAVGSEAEIHEILAKEPHVLSTRPFKGVGGVTVLREAFDPAETSPHVIINYYVKRRPLLQAFLRVSEFLPNSPELVEEGDSTRRVLSLLEGLRETPVSLEDAIQEAEDRVNGEIKKLMARGGGMDEFRGFIEDLLLELTDRLNLEEDEVDLLRGAANEVQALPFTFSPSRVRALGARYRMRMAQERYSKLKRMALELEKDRIRVDHAIRRLFELDILFSIARFGKDYDLHIPQLNDGEGIGFEKGRNLFLIRDQLKGIGKVESVSYSIGETSVQLFGAAAKPIAMLTGANSGGKTTLLETMALIHILTLLGLPVPAERADVPLIPLYLFRRRTVRKVGSLEYAIRVLRPVMTKHQPKVLLMDEFEALTEPGALGRIVASILNDLPKGSLTLFVTHLAREILPHLKTPVRVDGIEAKGIDDQGNLIVDRQPIFNHLGTSTPHLIISRLSKRAKSKGLQKVYQDMISLLEVGTPTTA